MTEENRKRKKKSVFLLLLKRVKISHLIVLAVLLVANTFAWFIYVNTVTNNVEVHVRSWKVDFTEGENEVSDYVDVTVNNVYPGMTTFTKEVQAHNYGEVIANVSYVILEADVMGAVYLTREGKEEAGLPTSDADYSSAQLETVLASDYPFHITFTLSSGTMNPVNGIATYTITVSWPYDSGDDETDTYWGIQAYDFKENNPGDPCIALRIKLHITQAAGQ